MLPKTKKPSHSNTARLILLLATALWGMSFSFVKAIRGEFYCDASASDFTVSASFTFVRFLATFVLYFLWVILWKKPGKLSKQEIAMGVGLGIFGGIGVLFQGDGMAYTDPGTSAFLTQLTCILVPLVALIRRRRALTAPFNLAMLFGFSGIYLLSGFELSTFTLGRGEAETILAAIFFSLQILLLESQRFKKHVTPNTTAVMFLLFALINLPFFSFKHLCLGTTSSPAVLLFFMGMLVFFCSLMSYGLMNSWQPLITGTEATFIYSLEAVFAVFFNFLWIPVLIKFGNFQLALQIPSLKFSIGALLLIVGNFFLFAESFSRDKKL